MSAVAAVGTGRRPHPVTPSTGPASGLGRCAGGARAPRIPGVSGFRTLDPGELTTPITHREVERKVRVPADFELPPLGGIVPGVTDVVAGEPFTMVAAYHDTHDLRLIRWGATLRRREGGPDEGWHLKLPVADEEPLVRDRELQVPALVRTALPTVKGRAPADQAKVVRVVVGGNHREGLAGDDVGHPRDDPTKRRELEVCGDADLALDLTVRDGRGQLTGVEGAETGHPRNSRRAGPSRDRPRLHEPPTDVDRKERKGRTTGRPPVPR